LKTKKPEASTESRIVTSAYDYTTKPNFEKRSTAELIFRVCYLLELDDYSKTTPQGSGKDAASKTGVKEEIKQIRQALTARGMSKEEMDKRWKESLEKVEEMRKGHKSALGEKLGKFKDLH
jgi:predicted AAA+ superfamily ATPase